MAIQKIIKFALFLAGNGTAKTIAVDFKSDPVVFELPNGGEVMSFDFSLVKTPITGIVAGSLVSSDKNIVSATVVNGIATFTFTKAPKADFIFTLTGAATVNVLES